jgi:hypothetical protein
MGDAPNDWKPSINSSGVRRPLKPLEKALIALAVIVGALFIGEFLLVYFEIDVNIPELWDKIVSKLFDLKV